MTGQDISMVMVIVCACGLIARLRTLMHAYTEDSIVLAVFMFVLAVYFAVDYHRQNAMAKKLRLYRFMSAGEYNALISGQHLTNTTDHSANGNHTTSVGFCFTSSPPFKAIHWLSGLVDTDYCVCVMMPAKKVKQTRGQYPAGWKSEYCCSSYSLDEIELVYASKEWSHLPGRKETEALLEQCFGLVPVNKQNRDNEQQQTV